VIRSILTVPGHRLDWIEKARAKKLYGADAVLLDLEDSVPEGKKDEAVGIAAIHCAPDIHVRLDLRTALPSSGSPGVLALLESYAEQTGYNLNSFWVWVPKFERGPEWEVASEARRLGFSVCLCIESPRSVLDLAGRLDAYPDACQALAFGRHDFAASAPPYARDLGFHAAATVAMHAAARGIPCWMAPSYDRVAEVVEEHALDARSLGFTGMGAIRPRDVEIVRDVFAGNLRTVESARLVLAGAEARPDEAVFRLETGQLVSPPTVRLARKVLEGA
jgi:citrate lyase subunit beta/citryl-CoA lyase